jgi:DNA repair exonuclease SbcCD ATPase subunit
MSVGELEELIAEANEAERQRLQNRIARLEDQLQEVTDEYEAARDRLVEDLRPLRRRVENRERSAVDSSAVNRRRDLEGELREVRSRFRRERQELERELVDAREVLDRVCEADMRVEKLMEEILD